MRTYRYYIFIFFIQSAFGQNMALEANTINAIKTKILPNIDGIVIDDPAWKKIDATTGFIQQSPDEGKPATEKTEVKIILISYYPGFKTHESCLHHKN